jgi:hypothetical protein
MQKIESQSSQSQSQPDAASNNNDTSSQDRSPNKDDNDSEFLETPRPFSEDEDEEELEIPYYQSFSFPGSSQMLLGNGTARNEEPLRSGDVIQYTNPMYVAGTAQGRRITQILAVDPSDDDIVLSLANAEILPKGKWTELLCVCVFA